MVIDLCVCSIYMYGLRLCESDMHHIEMANVVCTLAVSVALVIGLLVQMLIADSHYLALLVVP